MVGTSSMAHGAARRVEDGLQVSIRLPGLEVATIGGGTTLPYARRWLELLGCAGAGKVYRFAQIVAAGDAALGSRPLRRWRRRARPSSSARTTSAADFAETSDRTVGRVSSR